MEGHNAEPIRTHGIARTVANRISQYAARTIRWVKTHVGWDMPIEMLKIWIKESVVSQVT